MCSKRGLGRDGDVGHEEVVRLASAGVGGQDQRVGVGLGPREPRPQAAAPSDTQWDVEDRRRPGSHAQGRPLQGGRHEQVVQERAVAPPNGGRICHVTAGRAGRSPGPVHREVDLSCG